jgi:hypothetical protein
VPPFEPTGFATDKDQLGVRLSVPFRHRSELPFSVQTAILFEVYCLSVVAIHVELKPSRSMARREIVVDSWPSSRSLDLVQDARNLDSKLDSKLILSCK